MSPPVPSTPWRQLSQAEKDGILIIDGHPVPKGISVGVNVYSLHHNEEYFPDPFKFSPERWLESVPDSPDGLTASRNMRNAFCPFSIGARSCAGSPWLTWRLALHWLKHYGTSTLSQPRVFLAKWALKRKETRVEESDLRKFNSMIPFPLFTTSRT